MQLVEKPVGTNGPEYSMYSWHISSNVYSKTDPSPPAIPTLSYSCVAGLYFTIDFKGAITAAITL